MLTTRRPRLLDPASLELEPIRENAGYRAALADLEILEKRLQQTRTRREQAKARNRGEKPSRSAIERAKDLLAGGRVPGSDPDMELAACNQEEFEILRPAIAAQAERVNDLLSDLSLAAAEKLREQHNATLLAAFRAMEDMAAAVDAMFGIAARLISAGYDLNYNVLPQLIPHQLAVHSKLVHGNSTASTFKQELEKRGIL